MCHTTLIRSTVKRAIRDSGANYKGQIFGKSLEGSGLNNELGGMMMTISNRANHYHHSSQFIVSSRTL